MTLLALDLGTSMGWCCGTEKSHQHGTWVLKPKRHESSGMRFVHMRANLVSLKAAWPGIGMVYYEEVRRHKGVDAAHVYAGFLSTLQTWCIDNGIEYSGMPVGEIKKAWTGKGNASKEMMIAECEDRGYVVDSEDAADAVAIFHLGLARAGT